jgi:hypothetical protein
MVHGWSLNASRAKLGNKELDLAQMRPPSSDMELGCKGVRLEGIIICLNFHFKGFQRVLNDKESLKIISSALVAATTTTMRTRRLLRLRRQHTSKCLQSCWFGDLL